MGKMKELDIDGMNVDPDGITLKEWFLHMKWWFMTCPLLDRDLHTYSGMLSSPVKNCIVCGREVVDEVDEEELRFDNKFSEFMKEFDLGED